MATFVALMDFTDQGIRNIKDTCDRADAFVGKAKELGVTVKDVYWTVGDHDGVIVLEAPDDETVAGLLVSLGSLGNVRTRTLTNPKRTLTMPCPTLPVWPNRTVVSMCGICRITTRPLP